jgi:hypothetical protein
LSTVNRGRRSSLPSLAVPPKTGGGRRLFPCRRVHGPAAGPHGRGAGGCAGSVRPGQPTTPPMSVLSLAEPFSADFGMAASRLIADHIFAALDSIGTTRLGSWGS